MSDRLKIAPAVRLRGVASVPGDKSISHRLAMIGAIAEDRTTIQNFAESADFLSTLDCLRRLGVPIHRDGNTVTIEGRGLAGLRKSSHELDAGNSGTTVRLMSGIMAGFPFESIFIGDESLSRRPMKRIMEPLRRFGAILEARDDNYLPLKIRGGSLSPVSFTMPIASAQVKSAVLLAGLHAGGTTKVNEAVATRNHTEIALAEFGAGISTKNGTIEIEGGRPLRGKEFHVPGDLSSAAFLAAAALCVPNSRIELKNVGLNPTRSGFLSLLQQMGPKISVAQLSAGTGEPVGDIKVETSELEGMDIGGSCVPKHIEERALVVALLAHTRKRINIRDAQELRGKENGRSYAPASHLRGVGVQGGE